MRILVLFSFLMAVVAAGQTPAADDSAAMISTAHKLIVVTTVGWNEVSGQMIRYERHGKAWKKLVQNPIVVGKSGMAWDSSFAGRSSDPSGPIKREGDGRSPAGVFRIARTFGFAPKIGDNAFYTSLTPTTECVDDVNSKYYNQIVDRMNVKDVDWNSSEKMRQVEGYRVGAEIAYNAEHTPGRGSCIFLHIWSAPDKGTAGCTAMPDPAADNVMRWLDDKTALVQMPQSEYDKFKKQYGLP